MRDVDEPFFFKNNNLPNYKITLPNCIVKIPSNQYVWKSNTIQQAIKMYIHIYMSILKI